MTPRTQVVPGTLASVVLFLDGGSALPADPMSDAAACVSLCCVPHQVQAATSLLERLVAQGGRVASVLRQVGHGAMFVQSGRRLWC